ncbi:MAG TPA: tRNA (adenosine(37)-N6)-threonylcarbamoyltransferase complex ATPase subunit type 1 TsaE [Bacteroidales bacterium]|jgi:tRNA threonylcarbamoyladenosine biosynthesis protein TsaE|nr:tRNA (adenosine(37)-N6)-threonylcarbamoyltransferase complex ATPase subunit type 1 TsaE [Bacteroidales bacterium]HNW67388.1 tRNA (adenosine(37)-N6)-threonylcarbamoyltransferase complex ATPase subunit type 1 TsaE [Bacteroidales bacterium]HPT51863.1 tRNA (adenosine(37)-N6)-threonylcarbamoyltransferase complex ATPase subunit type 1 TsaE [Bacteroidales bacterium]
MKITIHEEDELQVAARQLISEFSADRVFCFYGEMGAGKTTFIKKICELLGATDVTSSPTFSIVNEYVRINGEAIYHFDFYRIEKLDDAYQIGVEDYLYSGNYCFLEWPENVAPLIEDDFVKVKIEIGENYSRIIQAGKYL